MPGAVPDPVGSTVRQFQSPWLGMSLAGLDPRVAPSNARFSGIEEVLKLVGESDREPCGTVAIHVNEVDEP